MSTVKTIGAPNFAPKRSPSRLLVFRVGLLLILLLAAGLRLYKLGVYPQIFDQDEQVMGYDAWSLWQTGHDHHGALLPVFFQTFDDYVPPVSNYITAPFVGILGLDQATTRLPMALMGIATVGLVALLGRRWFGAPAGLAAALFLAIDPWHVNYSRIAFPSDAIPFFTTLALYTFTCALAALSRAEHGPVAAQTRQIRWPLVGWFSASALSFAALTGTYPTMKVQAPILLGVCLIAGSRLLWRHRRIAAAWLILYALLISPLVIVQLTQWSKIQGRFNTVSLVGKPDWVIQAARLYADHFNPGALAFSGFGGYTGVVRRPLYVGQVFWLEVPLWGVAFYTLARRSKRRRRGLSIALLCALWWLTYPIADSLTTGDAPYLSQVAGGPHDLRSLNFLPLPELLAGFGVLILINAARHHRWRKLLSAITLGGGAVLLIAFMGISLTYFFGTPLPDTSMNPAGMPLNLGLSDVLASAATVIQPCDTVYMQPIDAQAYILYLFYAKYPPARFQAAGIADSTQAQIALRARFNQVRLADPDIRNLPYSDDPACAGKPQSVFYVLHAGAAFPGWREVTVSRNSIGNPIWRLLQQRLPYFTDGRINNADPGETLAGYCESTGAIRVEAVDSGGTVPLPLYTVERVAIAEAIRRAAASGQNIRIGSSAGRDLYALASGELQFHAEVSGSVYDYIFPAQRCQAASF